MTSADVFNEIESMNEEQLDDLLQAIKDRLNELRDNSDPVMVGDVVEFSVRKLTVTGVVAKTTDKRCTVNATLVDGEYTINQKDVNILEAGSAPTVETEIPSVAEYDDRF